MVRVPVVPHPISYQGSKRQLATRILGYLPPKVERLVEPFAGSAAMSLSAATYDRAGSFWLNDSHQPLMALWRQIVAEPAELADRYEQLWRAQQGQPRAFFDKVRNRFNQTHNPADFLYLLARCVKAAIRYNARGEFNNTPDNRRLGVRPAALRARLQAASALLKGRSELTSLDYREVLARCCRRRWDSGIWSCVQGDRVKRRCWVGRRSPMKACISPGAWRRLLRGDSPVAHPRPPRKRGAWQPLVRPAGRGALTEVAAV